jgi:dolichol-phosphate mannosyltransferase
METLIDFALVIPLANEAAEFKPLVDAISETLDTLKSGKAYFIVDTVSKDNTLELCKNLSLKDPRFVTIYEPKNRNVVDAYLRGYKEAYGQGHEFILEMDAGLSHDPKTIPLFLEAYKAGYDCVFGSRFVNGGSMDDSSFKRRFLSRGGTFLANSLLGTTLKDMTSGYQGFTRAVVKQILDRGLLSKAHFYQTEVRYLLRKKNSIEIPIRYRAPSPSVSPGAIQDSIKLLFYYFFKRISFKAQILR